MAAGCRAVVLQSDGKVFCAGADIKAFAVQNKVLLSRLVAAEASDRTSAFSGPATNESNGAARDWGATKSAPSAGNNGSEKRPLIKVEIRRAASVR